MLIITVRDLRTLAERVLAEIRENRKAATVLALHGELGAGKTAFTQILAGLLGVAETVTSPTFVIMRLYEIKKHEFFKTLVHIDAYRIASIPEIKVIGWDDLVKEPTNLICIEWAEKIREALPRYTYHITLTPSEDQTVENIRTAVYGYDTNGEKNVALETDDLPEDS